MHYPKERRMFSVREMAHACGVSRSTLIRMEECGFLTPYYINPDTGYRCYDAHNAAQIGQYLLLQQLGLTRTEITDIYYRQEKPEDFLKTQRDRLSLMQRILEELEVRIDSSRNFSCSFLDLPGMVCYCDRKTVKSTIESENFFYEVHEKCISEGFRLMGMEPMFGLSRDDYRELTANPQEITACIPVMPSGKDNPHLAAFSAGRAFSMVAYGNYQVLGELCKRFWAEFDKRKLKAKGPARFIGLVAPYTGSHIPCEDYCYRLAVPVKNGG